METNERGVTLLAPRWGMNEVKGGPCHQNGDKREGRGSYLPFWHQNGGEQGEGSILSLKQRQMRGKGGYPPSWHGG